MSRASFPLVVLAIAGTVAAGLRHGVVASPSEPGQTLRLRRNLLDNGGFERADRGVPVGWRWACPAVLRLEGPDAGGVWGVEYLSARCGDRLLVNLANYLRAPQTVRQAVDGVKGFRGRDLLSGRAVGETFQVPSLGPMLVEVLPDSSRRSVPQPDRK